MIVDEIGLSIVALVVSSMAIFAGLVQAGGPKLTSSFYGENPFAIKAAAINYYLERVFVALGVAGIALQATVYILADRLPRAQYTTGSYVFVLFAALLATAGTLYLLRLVAHRWARRVWYPRLFPDQSAIYRRLVDAAANDGLLPGYGAPGREGVAQDRLELNDKIFQSELENLEELFLERRQQGSLRDRVHSLAKIFE